MNNLAVVALVAAMIGMIIAVALAGMVAGLALDDWWHRQREREEDWSP